MYTIMYQVNPMIILCIALAHNKYVTGEGGGLTLYIFYFNVYFKIFLFIYLFIYFCSYVIYLNIIVLSLKINVYIFLLTTLT